LTDHKDEDQLHQKSGEEAGQTENAIISGHGEEIPRQSILDPQLQSRDGDRLTDVLPTRQAEVVETLETMLQTDATMMIVGMEVVMREEMIGDPQWALRKSLLKTRRQSVNAS
jgi:hypothetical protein